MRVRPTIILFTREPVPGLTKTRLARRIGANNAAALAEAFIRDAAAKARELKLPMVIAADCIGDLSRNRYFRSLARRFDAAVIGQGKGHLGLRMARALAPYLQSGALLVGTDTPSLPLSCLRRATVLLRHGQVVLGPTLDGGYYLIGLRKTMPEIFSGIRWGSSSVLRDTLARLRRAGIRPVLAPAWYDIDRWSDLMLLAEHLRHMGCRRAATICPNTAGVLYRLGLLS